MSKIMNYQNLKVAMIDKKDFKRNYQIRILKNKMRNKKIFMICMACKKK